MNDVMKVSFVLDNPKREVSAVRGVMSSGGQKFRYSAGVSLPVKLFTRDQRCKPHKDFPEANAMNERLEAVEAAMKNAMLYFTREFKTPTQEEFHRKVVQFLGGGSAVDIRREDAALVPFMERYLKECGKSGGTLKGYATTVNKVKEYQEAKRARLVFGDVTTFFEDDFKKWMTGQGFSRNYIGNTVKNVKMFMSVARKMYKLHDFREHEEFKVDAEAADTIFLSLEELQRVHRLEITEETVRGMIQGERACNVKRKVAAMDVARKKFLVGAFCAMRVSDFNRITGLNVKGNTITIMPVKGSTLRKPRPVTMPMHPVVREILAGGFDLNIKMSAQKINEHIKEVCRMAGITEPVTVYRTEGGKLVERTREKCDLVTTHTARRSGATNMDLAGMPIRLIMACTGHTKRETCEKYVKGTATDDLREIEKNPYFAGARGPADATGAWVKERAKGRNLSAAGMAAALGVDVEEVERVMEGEPAGWARAALFYFLG
jgi:site-specific recombinase XerD